MGDALGEWKVNADFCLQEKFQSEFRRILPGGCLRKTQSASVMAAGGRAAASEVGVPTVGATGVGRQVPVLRPLSQMRVQQSLKCDTNMKPECVHFLLEFVCAVPKCGVVAVIILNSVSHSVLQRSKKSGVLRFFSNSFKKH